MHVPFVAVSTYAEHLDVRPVLDSIGLPDGEVVQRVRVPEEGVTQKQGLTQLVSAHATREGWWILTAIREALEARKCTLADDRAIVSYTEGLDRIERVNREHIVT